MGQAPKGDTYNTDGEGYPLIAGAGDFDKKGGISVSKFTTAPTRLSEPGDIIMSIRASIGATVWADKVYCLGRGVARLKPGPELDSQFLWYWLPTVEKLLLSKARGATFVQVNRKDLEELPIELPPLDEQRKFAEEQHLKFLIQQKREHQQNLLKELKTAVFSSMFEGKDFPMMSLNEISLGKGTYGANLASEEYNSDKPRYIRITDINDDGSLNNDLRSPAGSDSDWEKYILKPGDLLFARSGATVGKTFLVQDETQKAIHAGYLIKFKLNRDLVNPDYIFSYTQTAAYKAWVKSKQNVVAQPNINAKQYGQELKIPIPPLAYQNKFSKIIGNI